MAQEVTAMGWCWADRILHAASAPGPYSGQVGCLSALGVGRHEVPRWEAMEEVTEPQEERPSLPSDSQSWKGPQSPPCFAPIVQSGNRRRREGTGNRPESRGCGDCTWACRLCWSLGYHLLARGGDRRRITQTEHLLYARPGTKHLPEAWYSAFI